MSTTEYVLLEEVSRCSVYLRSMLLYTASLQQNTISAEYARCLQHNYNIPIPANKCSIQKNIPFWIRVIFLWGNAVCFCRDNIQTKYDVFLQKLHHALWRSAVCISRCLSFLWKPFRKVNIPAQYVQNYWHRASLSKVQYVWNCEHY